MSVLKGAFSGSLAALDTGGGVVGIANPEDVDIIVTRVVLDVTTKTTAACTLDGGIAAAITTSSDNLIDGLDVNAATGVFGNIQNKAGNGKELQRWDSDEFFTLSKKTGAAAGLVGSYFIEYYRA